MTLVGGALRDVSRLRRRGAAVVSRNAAALLLLGVALAAAPATASHEPSPLADPIPGTIPAGPFTLRLAEVATGLVFPTKAVGFPDGSDRVLVAQRGGVLRLVKSGVLLPAPFLDISASLPANAGSALSTVAFHPQFAVAGSGGEGRFYTISQEAASSGSAHFGAAAPVTHQSVVYEWRVSALDPDLVDVATRREILRVNEKTSVHNLNDLAFGPDGYLYISKGDDDMTAAGRLDGSTIDGSVLRIDVDDTGGNGRYTVPADNPFVADGGGRIAEVYAYGFRNPWRISFDPATGGLYAADNGEDDIEEIDLVQSGRYYGWIDKEGSFAFLDFNGVTDDLSDLPADFAGIDPVAEYDHTEGDRSIAGGFFYRGTALPGLQGQYVFGDFVSGRLMLMDPVSHAISTIAIDPAGAALGQGIIGFGETGRGELLIVVTDWNTMPTGRVLRVVGGDAPVGDTDADGIGDHLDNCTLAANGPLLPDAGGLSQRDADADGFGNLCDGDFDGSGFVNFADLALFRAAFGSADPDADLDGNGFVNFADLARFRSLFGKVPGPSAAAP
jgi:glucose/arabinose dehydrogenase